MRKECGVYKYVYNDEIIYIGQTKDSFANRINHHAKEPKFEPYLDDCQIYVCDCANPTEAKVIESALINEVKPILNKQEKYKTRSGLITISELSWTPYDDYRIADRFFESLVNEGLFVEENELREAILNIYEEKMFVSDEGILVCSYKSFTEALRRIFFHEHDTKVTLGDKKFISLQPYRHSESVWEAMAFASISKKVNRIVIKGKKIEKVSLFAELKG